MLHSTLLLAFAIAPAHAQVVCEIGKCDNGPPDLALPDVGPPSAEVSTADGVVTLDLSGGSMNGTRLYVAVNAVREDYEGPVVGLETASGALLEVRVGTNPATGLYADEYEEEEAQAYKLRMFGGADTGGLVSLTHNRTQGTIAAWSVPDSTTGEYMVAAGGYALGIDASGSVVAFDGIDGEAFDGIDGEAFDGVDGEAFDGVDGEAIWDGGLDGFHDAAVLPEGVDFVMPGDHATLTLVDLSDSDFLEVTVSGYALSEVEDAMPGIALHYAP